MSARLAAAELLAEVAQGSALDDALDKIDNFSRLEGRDRAFARAIVMSSLRRQGGLDAVLERFLERPLPETAHVARAMLRAGAAQILVMNTPAHAAVGETVAAANASREARGFAKLINAVLRRVGTEGLALFAALPDGADLPAWLHARWRATYGDAETSRIARALRDEPPLDLSAKSDPTAWAVKLGGALTPTESIRLPHASVERLEGYDEGAWWVQDAAAALPAQLLGDVRGKTVADLCAAPGGKTLQLAAAGALVTAVDRSRERLEILQANLARTKLSATIVAGDVRRLKPKALFDAVLLDAPCTATGTLRRHPDIAWLRRPDDVRALAALQTEMLAAAARFVKSGGHLVYAVCSLEPEEGEGALAASLASGAWRLSPITRGEIAGADEFINAAGALRTLPSHWPNLGGLDGFFAARLVRV